MGSYCLMDTEFQLCKILQEFYGWKIVVDTQQYECTLSLPWAFFKMLDFILHFT